MRLLSDPLRIPVEQIVSEYIGREWKVCDVKDMHDFACHQAAILSDGSYSVFVKLSDASNGSEQFEIELSGLRLLTELSGVLTPTPIGNILVEGGALLVLEAAHTVDRGPRQWRQIGQALARIHKIKGDKCGPKIYSDQLTVEKPMIEIVPYKSSWPSDFREIAFVLRSGLGELALRLDHIGSTSVPGLAAKDVLDIQITVTALDHEIVSAMSSLGYSRPEGIWRDHHPAGFEMAENEWEKWFFNPPPGQRLTNTHVRIQGRANQRYPILFRDYLRSHPATADAYAELKRRLAKNLANPRMYPDVKDPAVDLIYLAAEEWAASVHWQPGPTDA